MKQASVMRWMVAGVLALGASGCAGKRHEAAVQDLKAQVGVLESRVSAIDERQQTVEQTAMRQQEDVAYLKGKTAATATNISLTNLPADEEPAAKAGRVGHNRGYVYRRKGVSIGTKDIQRALKRAGYYTGPVDGVIGPRTKRAIRSFQKANGLKSDGVVGQRTWAKLEEFVPSASK